MVSSIVFHSILFHPAVKTAVFKLTLETETRNSCGFSKFQNPPLGALGWGVWRGSLGGPECESPTASCSLFGLSS
eukprot:676923-Prorocentrum_minimum.AAC.2